MVVEPERPYPVSIEGELDPGLSRWLWLVKWLLAIPHYIILFFLGIAYFILTIVAFYAILFTGRYPRGIFNFNVGGSAGTGGWLTIPTALLGLTGIHLSA